MRDNKYIMKLMESLSGIMTQNREYLIQLDSIVGDGDLGLTMSDGFKAAYEAVKDSEEQDIGRLLYGAAKAMANKVPSTMGTLMASGWMQAAKALRGKKELANEDLILLFSSFEEGVANRGKAKIGEKTFLDGLHPAIEAMKTDSKDVSLMAERAVTAAEQGYENTATMIAVHGRAATRGEASRTLKDPGAKVASLMMQAFEQSLK